MPPMLPEEVGCYRTIATELNNVGADLYEQGERVMAIDLYQEAVKAIMASVETDNINLNAPKYSCPINKQELVSKILNGNKKLHKSLMLPQARRNMELDMYQESSSACDRGARPLLEAMKIILPSTPEEYPVSLSEDFSVLILYNIGIIHLQQGSVDVAQKLFLYARDIVKENVHSNTGIVYPAILNNIGVIQYKHGNMGAASRTFNEALYLGRGLLVQYRSLEDEEELLIARRYLGTILSNIGRLHYSLGNYQAAMPMCREALKMRRLGFGDDHIDVVTTLYNIGLLYRRFNEHDKALQNFRAFLNHALSRSNLEKEDKVSIKDTVTVLIDILLINCRELKYGTGSFDIDQELKKLQATRDKFGYDHPAIPVILGRLAKLLSEKNEHACALQFYLEKLRLEKLILGPHHSELAFTLNQIGQAYQQEDMIEKAMETFEEALTLARRFRKNKKDLSILGVILYNVGMVHFRVGSDYKALQVFKQALKLRTQALGINHPDIATLMHNIGMLQLEAGNVTEAMETFEKSLQIRLTVYGKDNEYVAQSMYQIGRLHHEIGEIDQAMRVLNETVQIERKIWGTSHPDVAITLFRIAEIHYTRGDTERALEVYKEVLYITRNVFGDEHPSVASTLSTIGNLYFERGQTHEAMEAFTEAARILQGEFAGTSEISYDPLLLLAATLNENDGFTHPHAAAAA